MRDRLLINSMNGSSLPYESIASLFHSDGWVGIVHMGKEGIEIASGKVGIIRDVFAEVDLLPYRALTPFTFSKYEHVRNNPCLFTPAHIITCTSDSTQCFSKRRLDVSCFVLCDL